MPRDYEQFEEASVYLRNFISQEKMDCALREIFDSRSRLRSHLREKNIRVIEDSHGSRQPCECSAQSGSSVLLLVLNLDTLERACQWLVEQPDPVCDIPTIAVADLTEPDQIQKLLECGVTDFVLSPFNPVSVLMRIQRCLEYSRRSHSPVHALKETLGLERLIGKSPVFRKEVEKIPKLARCDATVLIAGETGTGKELCASAIHYLSARAGQPFVPINCSAIPLELIENELFGHDRGAYTGAVNSHSGMIGAANGGTLFLDEIDWMPPSAQVKLLRFLQNKEYRVLGSNKTIQADVRVIAASNANFQQAIESGRLRQDLYYRLDVLSLRLPPLRERSEDIPLLASYFLNKYAREFDKPVKEISQGALRKLAGYHWPGNVRELENMIERAVALSESRIIRGTDINLPVETTTDIPMDLSFHEAKARCVEKFERDYIQRMLSQHQGNITRAAIASGKDRRTFFQLIRKHKIDARSFKISSLSS